MGTSLIMTTIDLWVDLSQGVANTQIEFEFSLLTFAEGELEIESLLTCDAEGKKKKKPTLKPVQCLMTSWCWLCLFNF